DQHEVDTVRDGAEALYRIEQRAYDLIISDLQMPNLDGPGLYTALRKRFGEALPRVIFVTGHAEADKFVPFLAETGDPVLTKPFSVEDLRTLVQWVLESRCRRSSQNVIAISWKRARASPRCLSAPAASPARRARRPSPRWQRAASGRIPSSPASASASAWWPRARSRSGGRFSAAARPSSRSA